MKRVHFFAQWYKFRKVKSYFNNYWVDIVKNGQGLIDHGTFQSGVSDKWFDQLSRLIEWFVHADSDGRNNVWFDCQSTFCLTFKCCGTIAVVLSHICSQKFPIGKNKVTQKQGFSVILKNFAIDFAEVSFNKNLYYLFYCRNPISVKILALQLQLERLSTN